MWPDLWLPAVHQRGEGGEGRGGGIGERGWGRRSLGGGRAVLGVSLGCLSAALDNYCAAAKMLISVLLEEK